MGSGSLSGASSDRTSAPGFTGHTDAGTVCTLDAAIDKRDTQLSEKVYFSYDRIGPWSGEGTVWDYALELRQKGLRG